MAKFFSAVPRGETGHIPKHIAIVMDGNGRWAQERGYTRSEGHRAGARRVKEVARTCIDLGVQFLTIYAFSKENWKRPRAEISAIMKLTEIFYQREFKELRDEGVHFVHLGDRENLPKPVIRVLNNIEANNTNERRLVLSIAFNYSGRSEIARAARLVAEESLRGVVQPRDISEEFVGEHLYTSGIPDVDLFIRTGGEMRVSNFLLWQIAYAEIWVTDVLWPDFTGEVLKSAIDTFGKRERRFGGV